MKKKHLKEFREVAKIFPNTYNAGKIRVLDAELLKQNPDKMDNKGKPVDANTYYLMDGGIKTNHNRALKKAFQRGGMPAVEEYVKQMASLNVEAGFAKEEQNKQANDLVMSFQNRQQTYLPAGF